jgi:hypothetical protein
MAGIQISVWKFAADRLEDFQMKFASNALLGMSMTAGAAVAAIGIGLQTPDSAALLQAAPAAPLHFTPEPPSPPPPPPPPAMTPTPNDDYWTGQGSAGGAPGAGGGG